MNLSPEEKKVGRQNKFVKQRDRDRFPAGMVVRQIPARNDFSGDTGFRIGPQFDLYGGKVGWRVFQHANDVLTIFQAT